MSKQSMERLQEWAIYFHKNKDRIPPGNLKARCEFQEMMIDGLLELNANLLDDLHNAINDSQKGMTPAQALRQAGLIIPRNLQ